MSSDRGFREKMKVVEEILEEEEKFTKEEKDEFRESEKNPINIEELGKWTDEFLNGKKVILTKEQTDRLRERYKEKHGEYPPEPKNGVYYYEVK